jgi:hypothetical protein
LGGFALLLQLKVRGIVDTKTGKVDYQGHLQKFFQKRATVKGNSAKGPFKVGFGLHYNSELVSRQKAHSKTNELIAFIAAASDAGLRRGKCGQYAELSYQTALWSKRTSIWASFTFGSFQTTFI